MKNQDRYFINGLGSSVQRECNRRSSNIKIESLNKRPMYLPLFSTTNENGYNYRSTKSW